MYHLFYVISHVSVSWQAGTQFWDEKLQNELAEGRVSGTTFDRLVMPVLSQSFSLSQP